MVRNGIFWTIGEQTYIVYYPIIYDRKIKVYRVKTMSVGRFCWNNGVSIKCNRGKYYGTSCTRYDTLVGFLRGYVRTWSHTLNNV